MGRESLIQCTPPPVSFNRPDESHFLRISWCGLITILFWWWDEITTAIMITKRATIQQKANEHISPTTFKTLQNRHVAKSGPMVLRKRCRRRTTTTTRARYNCQPTILERPPPFKCGDCGLPLPPTKSTDNIPIPLVPWGDSCCCCCDPGECDTVSSLIFVLRIVLCFVFNGDKCARWPCGVVFKTARGLASDYNIIMCRSRRINVN